MMHASMKLGLFVLSSSSIDPLVDPIFSVWVEIEFKDSLNKEKRPKQSFIGKSAYIGKAG